MPSTKIQEKIDAANAQLTAAEDVLDSQLREMNVSARAQKTTVSKVVEDAIARVRAAKHELMELRRLLTDREGGGG